MTSGRGGRRSNAAAAAPRRVCTAVVAATARACSAQRAGRAKRKRLPGEDQKKVEGGAGADNNSDAEGGSGSKHMVGAYSPRARRARIERFLEKRKQRVWTKKTQYSVREKHANSRMRMKGRFITKDDEAMLKELMALS